jgi:hypothetical protein
LAVNAVLELENLISSGACCDEHTADQLVIFMCCCDGASRILIEPVSEKSSLHLVTAIKMATDLTGVAFDLADVIPSRNLSADASDEQCATLTLPYGGCRLLTCFGRIS